MGKFQKMKLYGRKRNTEKETKNKYGEEERAIESEQIDKVANFTRIPFKESPEGGDKRRGISRMK